MATSDEFLQYKRTDVITRSLPLRLSIFGANARMWMSSVLVISDTLSLLAALFIAATVRMGSPAFFHNDFYASFVWVPVLILMIIYFRNGLYPGIGLSAVEELRRLSFSTTLLFLVLITVTFLLKTTVVYSRIVFLLAWMIALIALPISRYASRRICVRLNIWGEPVGIVGFPDRRLDELAHFFEKYPQRGIIPGAIFTQDTSLYKGWESSRVFPVENIEALAKLFHLQTVIVVVPNLSWVGESLVKYRYSFRRVILIHGQRDSFSLIDSIGLDFNGVSGFQICHNLLSPWSMFIKRLIDIGVSAVSLVVLSPFLALISLLILLSSPGGVFYRQNRLGKDGKFFKVLKFRTMVVNADKIFEAKLNQDKAFRDEWKKYQKVRLDPRITPIGSFLRRTSLDELPQLANILKGEMSLIGPRPIMVDQQELYGPGIQEYIRVRPGVTGLWQVSGRNLTTFARRVEYDMEYIQRWSLWLDLYIALLTIKEVLLGDGAY